MTRQVKKKVNKKPTKEVVVTPKCIVHTVRRGDTIESIASMYGRSVQSIISSNGTSIHVGKQIRIY